MRPRARPWPRCCRAFQSLLAGVSRNERGYPGPGGGADGSCAASRCSRSAAIGFRLGLAVEGAVLTMGGREPLVGSFLLAETFKP